MKKQNQKGYVLLEIIVSIVCILIMTKALIQIVDTINQDKKRYEKTIELTNIIDMVHQDIQTYTNQSEMLSDKTIDDYTIKTNIDKQLNEKLNKYEIRIYQEDILKDSFYIIKSFDN